MPHTLNEILREKLLAQERQGLLRLLGSYNEGIDFCSNDYLGLSRLSANSFTPEPILGSTGSRLISGNSKLFEELESFIAEFHRAEDALIFNSGYDANLGLLSCLCGREDTILYDEYCHASIRDGIRLNWAKAYSFRHNELNDLEEKLKRLASKTRQTIVVVESVYSMDGDFAPLPEIVKLCETLGCEVIVDEAHATGVFGPEGRGRVVELGLEKHIFARVHTFGKALGVHGAAVVGSSTLKSFLINFSRPFIYTTALPTNTLHGIFSAYKSLPKIEDRRVKLRELISCFTESASQLNYLPSLSPIQGILVPGNKEVLVKAKKLQALGFNLRAIRSPTVPEGRERIRINLHSFNTEEEIRELVSALELI